jgi:hypothetical protein
MDIPAPVSIGDQPTTAILATPSMASFLQETAAAGRVPLLVHELGGEKERATVGPRELLEQTRATLAAKPFAGPWGAGGRIRTADEAAHFAHAGFTWLTLELARSVNTQADRMTLDQLDAAIVALEDAGAFQPCWYEQYVDREFAAEPEVVVRFSDEKLARAAVKFAPAFALAEDMDRAIRASWSGRGELPDIEIALAPSEVATTREELLFVGFELRRRLSSLTVVAPALGRAFEPGSEAPEDPVSLSMALGELAAVATPAKLALPSSLAALAPVGYNLHLDTTEAGRLAWLAQAARQDPTFFREWLEAARQVFPIARRGWPISLSEEEARFLPQVEDAELEATFLGLTAGRQLLLTTWEEVAGSELGTRLRQMKPAQTDVL